MLAFIGIILAIGTWFFGGFTFMTLWAWFVASTFGIAVLSYAQSLGLLLVLSFFKAKHTATDDDNSAEKLIAVSVGFSTFYGLLLGFGAIIKLFV